MRWRCCGANIARGLRCPSRFERGRFDAILYPRMAPWRTYDEAFDAVPEAYRLHLASLRLPEHLTALAQADLHDAYVLEVNEAPRAARVRLRLRCGDLQRGYADVNIEYSGATHRRGVADSSPSRGRVAARRGPL